MTIEKLITDFLEYLEVEKGRSILTVRNYDHYLRTFAGFAKKNGVEIPEKIDLELVRRFRLALNRGLPESEPPATQSNSRRPERMVKAKAERVGSAESLDEATAGIFDVAEASLIHLSARMEEELIDLSQNEAKQYLESYGLADSGLVRLIKECYKLLNLITFYTLKLTTNNQQLTTNQIQAWPILKGTKAPQAAGKVHTDMERGFIAADVVHYLDFIDAGGWHESREKGKLRTEGKDYTIEDGDIVHFKFNV